MKTQQRAWRVENTISGVILGVYLGETERDAILAMVRDAGYDSIEEACAVAPTAPGEIVAIEVA